MHELSIRSARIFAMFSLLALALSAGAGADLLPNPGDGKILRRLNLDHFKVSDEHVAGLLKGSKDGPEHLGVHLWLAKESGRDVNSITRLRREGHSWNAIFGKLGVDTRRVFVTLSRPPGPPYGNAYGYWAHGPGSGKGPAAGKGRPPFGGSSRKGGGAPAPVLTDIEISDWVNASILSAQLGLKVEDILDRRSAGEPLGAIAGKTWREKHPGEAERPRGDKPGPPSGGGKGKGRP